MVDLDEEMRVALDRLGASLADRTRLMGEFARFVDLGRQLEADKRLELQAVVEQYQRRCANLAQRNRLLESRLTAMSKYHALTNT